ncbi:hypothetical protein [Chryseobacterium sp. 5_R23647]|uniref:hypothetical protein n=1 Tax=Chryseobacterium sp. 5_R23647 TaxID=2258964 RepID=UPI000E25A0AA|nr:hypothetical protein [Chryseobacterium sp. 5_R23647]REC45656.1 hypothetical protein DRF69_00610 [Chryseobacterium sp. 5_R23647]
MNLKWGLSFLFFIIGLSFLTFSCYQNRVYDWDMPGYLGSVYSWEFPDDPKKVQERVYSDIQKEASKTEFDDILHSNYPNEVFYADYRAFGEQLPYYNIKIGFNVAVYVLYKLGFSGPHSVLLVNIFSYFISGLLLFYTLKLLFPKNYFIVSLVSLFIFWLLPVREMAQNPTPDMFVFVFLMLFIISLLQKKSELLRFIFLLCCVLIRPDYVSFAMSYLFVTFIFKYFKENKKIDYGLFIQGFSLILIYIAIIKYYNYPGWKDVFYDSFIYRRPIISAQNADFTFQTYWDLIVFKLINFKRITLVSIILLCSTFYLSKDTWLRVLAILFFANIYIKFLFFPQGGTLRFFIGFVVLLLIIFLYALSKKYNGFQLGKIA